MDRFPAIVSILSVCLFLSASPAFAAEAPGEAAPVRIYGSSAFMERIMEKARNRLAEELGIRFFLLGNGSRNGLENLLDGECDAVMWSDPTDAAEGGAAPASADIREFPVAIGSVKVAVHPRNGVAGLSADRLRGILSGRIRNWKEVGGPDSEITVVLPSGGSPEDKAIRRGIMGEARYAEGAVDASKDPAVVRKALESPGFLWLVNPATAWRPSRVARFVEAPYIDFPLSLLTRGMPDETLQRIIDYLTVWCAENPDGAIPSSG